MTMTMMATSRVTWKSSGRKIIVSWIHRSRRCWYTSVVVSNVYPDVSASAACVRTNSIVQGLASLSLVATTEELGTSKQMEREALTELNHVYYGTSVNLDDATVGSNHPKKHGKQNLPFPDHPSIQLVHLPPNRPDRMKELFQAKWQGPFQDMSTIDNDYSHPSQQESNDTIAEAIGDSIDLVIFDRFYMEEAHSFRFKEFFPSIPLVLDMQDIHSLRWGRQDIVKEWDKSHVTSSSKPNHTGTTAYDPLGCLPQVMNYLPSSNDGRWIRELASIHRCDLTLVCSPLELNTLNVTYGVPSEKLILASFFVPDTNIYDHSRTDNNRGIDTRTTPRFVFCGGFQHAPNADAVRLLLDIIWPRLSQELPDASLHIYGAYCPNHLLQVSKRMARVVVHGYEADLASIFGNVKNDGILLAPLRFGAGIKGKIVDAWTHGMPVVTTPIGSEGMTICSTTNTNSDQSEEVFGGRIAWTTENFVAQAIDLATSPNAYRNAQKDAYSILSKLYSEDSNWEPVQKRLLELMADDSSALEHQRKRDCTQAMLWHQSMRSTEYFSRWIELKEDRERSHRSAKRKT